MEVNQASNGFRDIQWRMSRNIGWHDLDTTSKQSTSGSFILVPIKFSYTTSYRLSKCQLRYMHRLAHNIFRTDRRRLQNADAHCSTSATVARPLVRSANYDTSTVWFWCQSNACTLYLLY